MRCTKIKAQLTDYIFGELPERERHAIEKHLTGCEACRAAVRGLVRVRACLSGGEPPPPSSEAQVQLLRVLRARRVEQ